MTRRHADPIEVRSTAGRPTHFLWHDRLYAVREVLAHWRESGPWWEELASGPVPAHGTPAGSEASGPAAVLLDRTEREVWRVEASPGRAFEAGVYDLGLDRAAGRWTLTRTAD